MECVYDRNGYAVDEGRRIPVRVRNARKRRQKQVQRKRMFTMTLAVAVMLVSLFILSGFSAPEINNKNTVCSSYEIVTVHYNDTLWGIACEYYEQSDRASGKTVREYVKEIMKLNGLDTDRIYVGQKIAVPCYAMN